MDARGVIVTARASTPGFDFVSRFFAPAVGIDEDAATGGPDLVRGIFPVVATVTAGGYRRINADIQKALDADQLVAVQQRLAANRASAPLFDMARYARDFEAKYGPRNTFGGHAWDAVQIVLHAMEKTGADRAKIRSAIETTKNFIGISGVFDFSPTDHNGLDRRAASMIQIADGQWRLAK